MNWDRSFGGVGYCTLSDRKLLKNGKRRLRSEVWMLGQDDFRENERPRNYE